MALSPFKIGVWSKTFESLGQLGDPESIKAYPRHNLQPTATVTVRTDHQLAPKLLTEGCRLTIDYHGQQIISGPIDTRGGSGAQDGVLTLGVKDDWGVLGDMLGWPVPTAAITAQNTAEYDTKIGKAETVVKYFAQRAITRLGLPITVATDQGRGLDIIVRVRMQSLADMLFPLLDQAGIGVTVRQNGTAGLVLDCYETAHYPLALTTRSGVVTSWEWSTAAPRVTRAVVGGPGDGTARVFAQRVDTAAESLWGLKREVFVDATDADTASERDTRGDQAIADGAATAGLKLALAETPTFRYGDQVRVGDLVDTELVQGAARITEVLREAEISWTKDDGLTATPIVGDRSDDPNKTFARAIASVARAVRIDRARR